VAWPFTSAGLLGTIRGVLTDLETRTVRAALYSSKIHGVNQNSVYAEEFRWSSRGSGPENLIVGQGPAASRRTSKGDFVARETAQRHSRRSMARKCTHFGHKNRAHIGRTNDAPSIERGSA
jgi:hypothetical protein